MEQRILREKIMDLEVKETLEFGFFNELHHDPYCLEVEIHDLTGHPNITLILKTYSMHDKHTIDRVYKATIRKFKDEYGIDKDKIILESRASSELTLVYEIDEEKLLNLYGLFKLKGIGNGLKYNYD